VADTYPTSEVRSWCQAVEQLNDEAIRHTHSRWDVEHAAATEMTRWGFASAPLPVLRMMTQAVEAGYAYALRDVREGKYDDEIAAWRPRITGR
jgi:hypothetical protein